MLRQAPRVFTTRVLRKVWGLRSRLGLLPRRNVDYNRELWDLYSRSWDDPAFRESQLDPRVRAAGGDALRVLGDEWAPGDDLDRVVAEFIDPFVTAKSTAAEIGVGGGRVAIRVAPKVRRLICFDVSSEMLKRARAALADHRNVELARLVDARLPDELEGRLDFVYSFDVFLHLDLHTIWNYLQEMSRTLRPGGRALVHTLNLAAPAGWEMFAEQQGYSVEYGWFLTPSTVGALIEHTDLRLVKESRPDPSNLYLNRDYLAVLEKP